MSLYERTVSFYMKRSNFGHVEYVRHGVYRIRWNEGGRRRSKHVYGNRRDAERALGQIRLGLERPSEPDTFSQFWTRTVWPSCSDLALKTRNEYERLWDREIKGRMGHWRIGDTTHKDIQDQVIDEIGSPTVQRSTARLLSKVCNMAVVDGVIAASPCSTRFRFRRHEPREKELLETVDIPEFLETIEGMKYEPVFLMMIGGGLRMEEASVMRRELMQEVSIGGKRYVDVDIRRTLVTTPRKHLQEYTKTHSSRRHMLIGEPFATPLIRCMDSIECGPLMASGRAKDDDPASEYTSPATITHNWRVWCESNEVRYIRPGDMRTCWSTMQAEAGSPDSLVSLAMGHTDGSTRSRHYMKMTKKLMARLADNLEEAISESH